MNSMFNKQEERKAVVSSSWYAAAQKRWAEQLGSWTEGFSRRTLLWLLVLFVVLSGSFFLCTVYISFSEAGSSGGYKTVILKIKSINSK
ncbi:hypothetical protein [Flavobacterium sp. ACN6]|uniref:hypothetical protein n=1 Tax=Flavobacterium sp. ACN6 TaxID=1920426 RepID=UPI000BB3930D|nr:hypothetical protein [Flavobacterium sp. ACN6]PBJ08026.1 hypothetical protein BSF42_37430 [Flavobacterium sp. ACN6]